jgi:hypothetical protein
MPQLRYLRLSSVLLLFWLVLAVPASLYASPDAAGAEVKEVPAEVLSAAVSEAGAAPSANEAPASGEDIFAEPSPVRGMPEQVTLRAEYQPAPVEPPMLVEFAESDASQVALLPAEERSMLSDRTPLRSIKFPPKRYLM